MESPKNVLVTMADHYGLEPEQFRRVIKATCGLQRASDEDFMAFVLVAHEYKLNPLTREIYAFVKKDGGIQSIVSVDGWYKKMNEHPAFDGLEFRDEIQGDKLVAVTAIIHRKDRTHPTEVTEYMHECQRQTDPWRQWPARMLRHKAAIQCIRVAFNLAGLMDPDEAERYQDMLEHKPIEPLDLPGMTVSPPEGAAGASVEVSPPPQRGRRKRSIAPIPPPMKSANPAPAPKEPQPAAAPKEPEQPIPSERQYKLIDQANMAGMNASALMDYVKSKYGLPNLNAVTPSQAAEIEKHLTQLGMTG
jgi:phage recombination protein Bet